MSREQTVMGKHRKREKTGALGKHSENWNVKSAIDS